MVGIRFVGWIRPDLTTVRHERIGENRRGERAELLESDTILKLDGHSLVCI
jgi:hypothetical protein